METKYYYISFIWSDLGNNFECDVIDIHPLDWVERVNRDDYSYVDKHGKKQWVYNSCTSNKLINWIEISKEQFDSLKGKMKPPIKVRNNFELSYNRNPYE